MGRRLGWRLEQHRRLGWPGLGLGRRLEQWVHTLASGLDWRRMAPCSGECLLVTHRKIPEIKTPGIVRRKGQDIPGSLA